MVYLTGAQAAIATLRTHDVDTIFGIPGNHTLPLYDAIYAEPALRHVLARHEQGVGFMAEGYARASGRLGVACTITGPGATNIATPIAEAYADSIPLLVISSGLPSKWSGRSRSALHEIKNQLGSIDALAGWSRAVKRVEEIPWALHEALSYLEHGRPRAAYLEIPYDLLSEQAEVELPTASTPPGSDTLTPPPTPLIADAADLLGRAQRPLIVAGAGVTASGANEELAHLAELLQAPVLLGPKSHDVLPSDHPLVLTSTGGDLVPELRELVAGSDVALVVGSKLGAERTGEGSLPLPTSLIHIDIDATEIGRHYPATLSIVADARLALASLNKLLREQQPSRTLLPSRSGEVAAARSALFGYTKNFLGVAVTLLDALRTALPREAIVVADMMMLSYASARYFPAYEPRTFLHPVEFCTIGCALPLALGAKVARPERPVVALCGDGGFLLNASELATAVQEQIDVVVIVFNDSAFTAVKKTQHLRYADRYIATDLHNPDYVALAQAFGVRGMRVHTADELQAATRSALAEGGATLIEVPLPDWPWYAR